MDKELTLNLQIDQSSECLKRLCDGLAAAVKPDGGYAAATTDDPAPGTGCDQMVQVQWWIPQHGCDSLENTLNAIKGRLMVVVRDWFATALVPAARAALAAAPEGEGPSEGDVADLFYRHMGEGPEVGFENAIAEALARWGRPAAPPEGKVKELEGWLQEMLGSPSAAAAAQWETNIKYLAKLLRMADSAFLRQQLLQQENHRFREPERTILCDILANGTLLPDPDGTRHGDPSNAPQGGEADADG